MGVPHVTRVELRVSLQIKSSWAAKPAKETGVSENICFQFTHLERALRLIVER